MNSDIMERESPMSELDADDRPLALVLNRDLLFGSQIRGALKALGLGSRVLPDTARFVAVLASDGDDLAIAIIDMNGAVDWRMVGDALAAANNPPPTLAFGPHVDAANRRAAKAAGITRVVSNGQFHADASALVDRYRRR